MSQPCMTCGTPLNTTVETRRYGRGIQVILDQIKIHRCPKCGEEEVEIPQLEELHATISRQLAQKPDRLTPGEIRWLRTHLGYSSVDFAKIMGVSAETVSRWERVEAPKQMSLSAERLLRLMILTEKPIDSYKLEQLGIQQTQKIQQIHLIQHNNSWSSLSTVI